MDSHIFNFLRGNMRSKILVVAALVLFGAVVFSVYSSSNNGNISDNTDNTSNDNEGIVQKIEYNNSSFLEFSKDWDGFETVTIDINRLRKAVDTGHLVLRLMGENYEVEIQEASRNTEYYFYTGPVVGNIDSRVDLYLQENTFCGSVELGRPKNVTYNIGPTDEIYNGERIYIVSLIDHEKEQESLKKMGIDPLQFFLINSDSKKHIMAIEIFDFNNKSVFKENYTVDSGEQITSSKIDAELGQYRYEIILDNEFTFEENVQASYNANLSSSEKLYIYITNDPENPVTFGIEIA